MVEIDYSPVIDILEDILGEPKMHNDYRCQMSFDCPTCSYEIKGLEQLTNLITLDLKRNKISEIKDLCSIL